MAEVWYIINSQKLTAMKALRTNTANSIKLKADLLKMYNSGYADGEVDNYIDENRDAFEKTTDPILTAIYEMSTETMYFDWQMDELLKQLK